MKHYLIIFPLFFYQLILAQKDTIRIMQYNLLYYGVNTGWCTATNNGLDFKDPNLQIIFDYVNPDIFTVNEMGATNTIADHILDEVLNTQQTLYDRGTLTNYSSGGTSDISNMIFFRKDLFELVSYDVVTNDVRDINIYTLIYKPDQIIIEDTLTITCIIAHLKAGSTSDEEQKRAEMTSSLMSYLNNSNIRGNIFFMGDFNLYSSTEAAFQNITDATQEVYFVDPLGLPGAWHDNTNFRAIHTQSTHLSSSGCPASGGMDDRFDYILMTPNLTQSSNVQYIDGSYKAIGQDGSFFNSSVLDAITNAYPLELRQALYNFSDHLPVSLDVVLNYTLSNIGHITKAKNFRIIQQESKIIIIFDHPVQEECQLLLINPLGTILFQDIIVPGSSEKTLELSQIYQGIFFLHVLGKELSLTKKFILK